MMPELDHNTASDTSELSLRPILELELALLAQGIAETSEAQLANRWREQDLGYRELLVAELGGRLVGTVSIREVRASEPALHLFALEVANAERRRGIGRRIVETVVAEAGRRGCSSVYLEVEHRNPARRLYHRLGFRRVGGPFMNAWWKFNDDGTRDQQNELSYRMVKRVRARKTYLEGPDSRKDAAGRHD